jgi:hypothetical protein
MQHPRNQIPLCFSEEGREVYRCSHPQSLDGEAVVVFVLPPPRSFQGYWYEEKTKGSRWPAAEPDTTPTYRAEALMGTRETALIAGIYTIVLGEMMYRGMVEGTVVPKEAMLVRIS